MDKKGFSLVELIIATSIILIMTAVATPLIAQLAPHYRLSGASRELTAALRETQSLSVTKQNNYITRFSQANRNYSIIQVVDGVESIQETIALPRSITFPNINLTNSQITFTPSGAPLNSGTVILGNNREENITVDIAPSGQIKAY